MIQILREIWCNLRYGHDQKRDLWEHRPGVPDTGPYARCERCGAEWWPVYD